MRGLIVSGRIAPGARLIEEEIAKGLAVSRTPVREAVQRLAHEGLALAVGAGAKTQFAAAPVTPGDLVDLFAIIGALEGLAGRGVVTLSAAQRRALAAELTKRNAAFAREARRRVRDYPRLFAAHDAFHAAFVERCGSPRVRRLVDGVRPQVKRYELVYATAVGRDFSDSLREHRGIIAALRSGDADAAERAIRLNWSKSAERLSRAAAQGPLASLGDYRGGG
jgi:DNA-binding GntR family transcriptional regulator